MTGIRILPREVDPLVYNMTMEDPNGASFAGIGGLSDQIRELREVRHQASRASCKHPTDVGCSLTPSCRSSSFRS